VNWKQIFAAVTGSALAGMVLGGLFGYFSGKLTPDFFARLIPWRDVEPIGLATFFGATVGIVLGGALGCFGIIIQTIVQMRREKEQKGTGAT
jgi:membrane protein YqaA with SNARE-associated domain